MSFTEKNYFPSGKTLVILHLILTFKGNALIGRDLNHFYLVAGLQMKLELFSDIMSCMKFSCYCYVGYRPINVLVWTLQHTAKWGRVLQPHTHMVSGNYHFRYRPFNNAMNIQPKSSQIHKYEIHFFYVPFHNITNISFIFHFTTLQTTTWNDGTCTVFSYCWNTTEFSLQDTLSFSLLSFPRKGEKNTGICPEVKQILISHFKIWLNSPC